MIDRSAFAHPIAEVVEVVGEPVIGWANLRDRFVGRKCGHLAWTREGLCN
jgi:hypothetical protein